MWQEYEILVEQVPFRAVRVSCKEDTILAADSVCIISGEIKSKDLHSKYAQFERLSTSNGLNENLVIGSSVLSTEQVVNKNVVPVRLVNTSKENVTLKKGTPLGYIEELNENDILSSNSENATATSPHKKNKLNTVNIKSSWCKPLQD